MHRPGTRVASFTLSCLVALLLSAPGADARERMGRSRMGAAKSGQAHRTVTRTGSDGTARTSTHDTTWQRGGGEYSRDTVHTGPGGKPPPPTTSCTARARLHPRDDPHGPERRRHHAQRDRLLRSGDEDLDP